MSLPKAIFFDWDGTLVDSFAFLEGAHKHVTGHFGLPCPDFHYYFGKPRDFIYQDIYGDKAVEAEKLFSAYVTEHHAAQLKLIDGAEDLLSVTDIPMGIVTNKRGDFVRREIEVFGWSDRFLTVVGAGEAEEDKPSAAPLAMAAEGFEPSDIWYVGDSEADMECARNFGCEAIFIYHEDDLPDWIRGFEPLACFQGLSGFHDFLLQSAGNSLKQYKK